MAQLLVTTFSKMVQIDTVDFSQTAERIVTSEYCMIEYKVIYHHIIRNVHKKSNHAQKLILLKTAHILLYLGSTAHILEVSDGMQK